MKSINKTVSKDSLNSNNNRLPTTVKTLEEIQLENERKYQLFNEIDELMENTPQQTSITAETAASSSNKIIGNDGDNNNASSADEDGHKMNDFLNLQTLNDNLEKFLNTTKTTLDSFQIDDYASKHEHNEKIVYRWQANEHFEKILNGLRKHDSQSVKQTIDLLLKCKEELKKFDASRTTALKTKIEIDQFLRELKY